MSSPLSLSLVKLASFAGLVALATLALAPAGCASEAGDEATTGDEDDLKNAEKGGKPSQQWIYNGMLPKLDSVTVNASLKAHTVRVSGLLPSSFSGDLPFYAVPEQTASGRTRVTVVYPIATGHLDPTTGKAPASPGNFSTLYAVAYTPTNAKAPWGGFPFMMYNPTRGIAFHGPITSVTDVEMGDYQWHLFRGPVSHGCNRMEGEHIVEMAHMLGIDMSRPHSASEQFVLKPQITVSPDFDTWNGQYVDVDYKAEPGVTRPSTNVKMFKTWDSNDFPRFVCAYQKGRPLGPDHCATAGDNRRDPLTGKSLFSGGDSLWIGSSCTAANDCSFQAGGKAASCASGSAGGVCSIGCEGYCPDKAGSAATFCATVGGKGVCLPKADPLNSSCADLAGTKALTVDRFVGGSTAKTGKATVCVPQ